ncbi:hypothetical protein [Pseudomonas syringae]|uniref:Uncharacterized protein n=1 Tax=Pseudomonas syringae CC1417 TaxID=1357272 RepID=A0AAU8LDQ7_PSESX
MDGNSLESLLAWMKDGQNDVLHGWGAIAILSREQVNDLLARHCIARLTENAWLPPVNGAVDIIAGKQRDAIHGFLLDAPRLSFESADLDSDQATLSCSVVGGTWLTLTLNSGNWQVRTIKEVNPLLGPRLVLDVDLTKAPGQVDVDGRIMLDLQNSIDFKLTHAGTEDEQRLAGEIFKKAFTDLPEEQRVFVLGSIEADEGDTTGLMRPQAFILRAQAAPGSSHSAADDGAILVCISIQGMAVGSTIPPGYPYFIPDDAGKNYSAAVLFDGQMMPNVLLMHIAKSFGSSTFSFQYDATGAMTQATLIWGQLTVPQLTIEEADPETGEITVITVHEMALKPDGLHPLKLSVTAQKVLVNWDVRSPVNVSYKLEEDEVTFPFELGLALEATYELIDMEWHRTAYTIEKTYFDIAQGTGEKTGWSDLILFFIEIIITAITVTYQNTMLDHVSRRLDPVLEETLFASQGPEDFLDKNIKLGLNQIIESDSSHYPRNVAVFGRVHPALTHFLVSPLQTVIAPGSSQQFSVTPSVQGLVWSLESLHGSAEGIGSINKSSGLYQAPAVGSVSGTGVRVRVVATHSATGHVSAALVTVVVSQLSLSPVIQLCEVNGTVELAAQALGDNPLQWSVRPTAPGQGGTLKPSTLPDGDHTYVARPAAADATYVLDEVNITNALGSRSAWVLVVNRPPSLTVKPLESPEVSAGRIQLQAVFNGSVVKADWTLPVDGTGSIDDNGLYTEPEVFQEPFALVFATLPDDIFGTLEGHIILPLPLQQFPQELALMAAPASRRYLSPPGTPAAAASAPVVSAGNSVENIVAWMKDTSNNVMWGWGAIAALARGKVNALLLQEYIHRFSSDTYLPPISGEVQTVEDEWKEVLDNFILDAPRLAFTNDDLGKSHATLTCAMLGGTQLTLHKKVDSWDVERLICIDPLQGPRLTLDLSLDEVPGIVERDGRVRFDLKHSDHFILTFAHTERERKLGGDFFKDLFNTLPDEKRIWTLGVIRAGSDDSLRAKSFKMRTQADPQAPPDTRAVNYGDGAMLVFIRLEGSQEGGDVPVEYRYLIPDNPFKNYSATVLFEHEQTYQKLSLMERLVTAFSSIIEFASFTCTEDPEGRITKAVATYGTINVPGEIKDMPSKVINGVEITPKVTRSGVNFKVDGSNALTITRTSATSAVVTWKSKETEGAFIELENANYPTIIGLQDIQFEVNCNYQLVEEKNDLVIKPTLNVTYTHGSLDFPNGFPPNGNHLLPVILPLGLSISFWDRDRVGLRLGALLHQEFSAGIPLGSFIRENISLNFGQTIVAEAMRAPRDIAAFGVVNPVMTHFAISPLEHVMGVDTSFTFATDPPGISVDWSIEKLPGDSGDRGAINTAGNYSAPKAGSFAETFMRVRVTATHRISGYHSSALVTVLANPLTVNPRIQVCDAGASVELAGGGSGGARLTWSIKNPVEGESGELHPGSLPDSDQTYQAKVIVEPPKTYVLDEIEVADGQARASAWVLVRLKTPAVVITTVGSASSGQVQLQALINSKPFTVAWSIALNGPGAIDENGLYTVKSPTEQRFVLIFAAFEHPQFGTMEGHLILPLPLAT